MHKDQERVRDALIPAIFDRVFGTDPASERDCTILNRAFLQGPDPLFLMEMCPLHFAELCEEIGIDPRDGRDAIEQAHWRGPGVLLDGQGIPFDADADDARFHSPAWKREALWLVLAHVSDTTEEDYGKDITFLERMRKVTNAASQLGRLHALYLNGDVGAIDSALIALDKFNRDTLFTQDANGVPLTDQDAGFYVGYKRGMKVVAVHHGDKTFYGTTPDTTLAEQGVTVEVDVSPTYGFIRDPKP
jgi:hypothetical protein